MGQSKVTEMMEGKTLEKQNISKMYDMVEKAQDAEEKKNIMKHSVFFVGQLPLNEDGTVDCAGVKRILHTNMDLSEVDTYYEKLVKGLTKQTLLREVKPGIYEVNPKYDKSVLKVRQVAKAYEKERAEAFSANLPQAKRMYQMGTKYYHEEDYYEAAGCFMHAIEMAEYRMAYYSLAMLYKDGKGVDKSLEKALFYVRCSIAKGASIGIPMEKEILAEMGL